jgi:hypothetical protein
VHITSVFGELVKRSQINRISQFDEKYLQPSVEGGRKLGVIPSLQIFEFEMEFSRSSEDLLQFCCRQRRRRDIIASEVALVELLQGKKKA